VLDHKPLGATCVTAESLINTSCDVFRLYRRSNFEKYSYFISIHLVLLLQKNQCVCQEPRPSLRTSQT